ncbi:MAG TPA: DsbA family oxidoreductase [Xanthobacteraceae bacterium]|jgi:predicted DsbA family dithiol-disulfide isomerase|nr:DsbA family oxidoreductase [Xanthobacteraceae bacterium]
MSAPVVIDVVSDVVCPWCYIGKRRLERALELRPDVPVEVRYRPFFLNPWVPREGIDRADYLTTKFGSPERYLANAPRIAALAAEEGLTYAFERITRQPNTIDAHRLILWAPDSAKMNHHLMRLYFSEGADLTDRKVLVDAAVANGLDRETVERDLASDRDVELVTKEAARASEVGINGVPFFILNSRIGISGAQSPEFLAQAIDKAREEAA